MSSLLSHHRTCRSAYGGSVTCVQFIIPDKDIVISHLNNAFVCQSFLQYPTPGIPLAGVFQTASLVSAGQLADFIPEPVLCGLSVCTPVGAKNITVF